MNLEETLKLMFPAGGSPPKLSIGKQWKVLGWGDLVNPVVKNNETTTFYSVTSNRWSVNVRSNGNSKTCFYLQEQDVPKLQREGYTLGEFKKGNGGDAVEAPYGYAIYVPKHEKYSSTEVGENRMHINRSDIYYALYTPNIREDGTPSSIPPLPKMKGWRFEYKGKKWKTKSPCYYIHFYKGNKQWNYCRIDQGEVKKSIPVGDSTCYYAQAFKVEPEKRPITIEELFKNGENVWVYLEPNRKFKVNSIWGDSIGISGTKDSCCYGDLYYSMQQAAKANLKWTNSPLVSYEDAREFEVEESDGFGFELEF